jgi:molybdopterin synthase sulfur carrier subunit
MASVLVRYFAGARAAAGLSEEPAEAASVGELIASLGAAHGERLARTLTACSFLVDGVAARDLAAPLPDQATVDVLPPFAGG